MSHRAGSDFFERKLKWSERKDQILKSYLERYLPTLANRLVQTRAKIQGITVIDGFAGPGKFKSGEDGSPLIICKTIAKAADVVRQSTRVICIERSDLLAKQLQSFVAQFRFAEVRQSSFQDQVDSLVELATKSNLLLYLDPFTVDGLEWRSLDRIFAALQRRVSIEILLNFNAPIFLRAALAAFKLVQPAAADDDEAGELDWHTTDGVEPSVKRLDEVAGGDWWHGLARDVRLPFAAQVKKLTEEYCRQLRQRFPEVCFHDVFAKAHHTVPKYAIVFGSRSRTALLYMNNAMVDARDALAIETKAAGPATLFETLPESLVPDETQLPKLVLGVLTSRMTRKELTYQLVRKHFGQFAESPIHKCIRAMLKDGQLETSAPTVAIGDDAEIWPATSK